MSAEPVQSKFDSFEPEKPDKVLKIARRDLELILTKKVPFDHRICNLILGYKEIAGERPFRPNHVNALINAMRRGTYRTEFVNLVSCVLLPTKETYRMNGQHTAMARLEMPEKWHEGQQINLMTYEAGSYEAMRELYASIDRGAPRTKGNVLNSYLSGTAMFEDCPQTMLKLMGSGFALWMWEGGHERARHDSDEIAYLMQHDHKAITSTVLSFCLDEPTVLSLNHMRRASVVGAMFETFSKALQASGDFWMGVKTGVAMESVDDPRLRLRNALVNSRLTVGSTKGRGQGIDQETQYRWCINCFNRWRRGEQIKTVVGTKERQRAK